MAGKSKQHSPATTQNMKGVLGTVKGFSSLQSSIVAIVSLTYMLLFCFAVRTDNMFLRLAFKPIPIILNCVILAEHRKTLFGKLMLIGQSLSIIADELIAIDGHVSFVVGATIFGFAHFFYIAAYCSLSLARCLKPLLVIVPATLILVQIYQTKGTITWYERILSVAYLIDLGICTWRGWSLADGGVDTTMSWLIRAGMALFTTSDFILLIVQYLDVAGKVYLKWVLNVLYFICQFLLTLSVIRFDRLDVKYGRRLGQLNLEAFVAGRGKGKENVKEKEKGRRGKAGLKLKQTNSPQ